MTGILQPSHILGVCIVAVLSLAAAAMLLFQQQATVPSQVVPQDSVSSMTKGWADESLCSDCHAEADEFYATGHARTLIPASDGESWTLLQQLGLSGIGQSERVHELRTDGDEVFLVAQTGEDSLTRKIPVQWCFGSGTHARTWGTTLTDGLGQTDLLEFRWTWFEHTGDFNVTPGQPDVCGSGHLATFGLQFDSSRAWRCFRCHATRLETNSGHLDLKDMHAGVTCQACHGPRQSHVDSGGAKSLEDWIFRDRDQQVARCSECHRDSGEQDRAAIFPGNPDIARFQPIGLTQSRCFIESEMSCTTCHDVHRPMKSQQPRRISQCTQCHDSADQHQSSCSAGMTDRCVDCHMPTLDTGRGLGFSDHWIRIPLDSEPAK